MPTEVFRAKIELDNSRCDIRLTGVKLAVEQVLRISTNYNTFKETFTLTDIHDSGLAANHTNTECIVIELPLSNIK